MGRFHDLVTAAELHRRVYLLSLIQVRTGLKIAAGDLVFHDEDGLSADLTDDGLTVRFHEQGFERLVAALVCPHCGEDYFPEGRKAIATSKDLVSLVTAAVRPCGFCHNEVRSL